MLQEFKKVGLMISQSPWFHIKKREERIVKGFPWIEMITRPLVLYFREKPLSLILIGIKSVVPIGKDDDHLLDGMKGVTQIPFRMEIMDDNRLGNLLRSVISFGEAPVS
jgi:hypothetical protein